MGHDNNCDGNKAIENKINFTLYRLTRDYCALLSSNCNKAYHTWCSSSFSTPRSGLTSVKSHMNTTDHTKTSTIAVRNT